MGSSNCLFFLLLMHLNYLHWHGVIRKQGNMFTCLKWSNQWVYNYVIGISCSHTHTIFCTNYKQLTNMSLWIQKVEILINIFVLYTFLWLNAHPTVILATFLIQQTYSVHMPCACGCACVCTHARTYMHVRHSKNPLQNYTI